MKDIMRKRILIKGKVHEVGYRPFLLSLAESLEIARFFAENVLIDGGQAVEVLVEDSEEKVNAFIEAIKVKRPEGAEVVSIEVGDYEGSVMKTESYYRYLTAMQLAKIATYGGMMIEKMDIMLAKQDEMLRKQDETMRTIREESERTREEIGGKIDLLRSDLKNYIELNLKSIREEIAEIKSVLRKAGIM